MGHIDIIAENVAAIAVFYVLFGLISRRYRQRIMQGGTRLADSRVEAGLSDDYIKVAYQTAVSAQKLYWLIAMITTVCLYIGFQLYSVSQEPDAEISIWFAAALLHYGISLLSCAVVASITFARYRQVLILNRWIDEKMSLYPKSVVIAEVKEQIRPRVGEVGVSVLAVVAVTSSLLVGAGFIAILYMAAQAAIECARSSKCI